jgi:hypothetical protein
VVKRPRAAAFWFELPLDVFDAKLAGPCKLEILKKLQENIVQRRAPEIVTSAKIFGESPPTPPPADFYGKSFEITH